MAVTENDDRERALIDEGMVTGAAELPVSAADGEAREDAPSTVQGHVLMPMRDMVGFSLFTAWAFLFGWGRSLAPHEGDASFLAYRALLFGGIALGAMVLFATRGDILRKVRESAWDLLYPALCMLPGITFFVEVDSLLAAALWFLAGIGQSVMFFMWGVRLRILSSKQQLYVICSGFVVGGMLLAFMPFVLRNFAAAVVTVFPLGSIIFLRLAHVRFKGNADRLTIWNGEKGLLNGIRGFSSAIPFKSDRRIVVLKGAFSCLYSIFLGFVTCMVLGQALVPSNEVVIGIGNLVSALIMLIVLVGTKQGTDAMLFRLFLPVTCVSMCLLGAAWPTDWALLSAFLLFSLFGCMEILNVYSAYVGTSYDAVRWFWEIQASRMGNSVGFFIGWVLVVACGHALAANGHVFLLSCFIMSCVAVVAESFLFRHSIFEAPVEAPEEELDGGPKLGLQEPDAIGATVDEYYLQISMEMAEEYKLSPRQTEIFIYLARGRNVQFIREKLVVSTPTVKSHVYSIYQKMGIHSHQELIDMVEQRLRNS